MRLALVLLAACSTTAKRAQVAHEATDDGTPAEPMAKQTEPIVKLLEISKRAKLYFEEHGAFPDGFIREASRPCCTYAHERCPVSVAEWAGPPWRALEFRLTEPSKFRYAYEGDGKVFSVTVTGDPDCDGHGVSYELTGRIKDGVPETTFVDPGSGASP